MTIGTHDGVFHADEVFAIALLMKYDSKCINASIVRSREASVLHKCNYVLDVGGIFDPATLRFDHHQNKLLPATCTLVGEFLTIKGYISKDLSLELATVWNHISDIDTGKIKSAFMSFNYLIRMLNQHEHGFQIAVQQCYNLIDSIESYVVNGRDAEMRFKALADYADGIKIAKETFPRWKSVARLMGYNYLLIDQQKDFVLIAADANIKPVPEGPYTMHSGVAVLPNQMELDKYIQKCLT